MPTIQLLDKAIDVDISREAQWAMKSLDAPLTVEMELYFSCLIRKQVRFLEGPSETETVQVLPDLLLAFRPVTTETCRIANVDKDVPVIAMPVVNPAAFVPRWLYVDHRRGKWFGEFGYSLNGA